MRRLLWRLRRRWDRRFPRHYIWISAWIEADEWNTQITQTDQQGESQ